ncbi:MAG: hypothetical protein J0H69_00635 [Burkholderiales bacterium]|nr:hypothetical protein [Burkholderiales bacterium]
MNLLREKQRLLPLSGPCLGSKSSTASTTSSSSVVNASDERVVADNGAVVIGDGGSAQFSVTDLDSVQKAAEVAQAAVLGATQLATEASANVGKAFTQLKDAYAEANQNAQSVASGNKTIAVVGLIGIAVFALPYLQQMGRKR